MEISLIFSAFLAGLISFIMPCTLPLLPGFMAFLAGSVEDQSTKKTIIKAKAKIMKNSISFVLGFSLVFITFGSAASLIGNSLNQYKTILENLSGVVIIIFSLYLLGVFKFSKLDSNRSFYVPKLLKPGEWPSAILLGISLGLGWTPCIGPILGSILLIASTTQSMFYGAFLLAVFSLGLGLPFIIIAFLGSAAMEKVTRKFKFSYISKIGGAFLLVVGILQLTGKLGYFTNMILDFSKLPFYENLLDLL